MEARERLRQIRWTMLWVLGANLAVAAAKALYGWRSGSVSISSDAIHSALDGSANIIGLIGLQVAAAPADSGHPYGHRKFEILASAGVGLLIFAGGWELGRAAVMSLIHGSPPPLIGPGGFAVVLATIVANALVSRAEHRAGTRLESPFLVADSRHTASDMLASIAVLIAFVGARAGVRWADPLGGLIVLALVLRVGWRVLRENVAVLVDAVVVDPDRVRELAAAVAGVRSIHRVRSRGTVGAAHLDLHLLVDPELTVRAAHGMAHKVEDRLREGIPGLVDVTIHVEPEGDPEEDL
ncbi:MAG TPA: cation diffusion facilitator family transporter [Polyangia bacterium]|nr:cation diffusion facilitator family transporter [Polyangia bacterium]